MNGYTSAAWLVTGGTVTSSGTAVTGTGTLFLTKGVRAGDLIFFSGAHYPVSAVNSETSLTLAYAPAVAASNAPSIILRHPGDNVELNVKVRQLLEQLERMAALSESAPGAHPNMLIEAGRYSVLNPIGLAAGTWTITVETSPADTDYVLQTAVLADGGALQTFQRRKTFAGAWEAWLGLTADRVIVDDVLNDPNGLNGETKRLPLVNYIKGEILLDAYTIKTGVATAAEAAKNKTSLYYAAQASTATGRPIKAPRGQRIDFGQSGALSIDSNNVVFDFNDCELVHTGNAATTFINLAPGVRGFEIHNATLNGLAQSKPLGSFYLLAGTEHHDTVIENVTFKDIGSCGLYFSGSYDAVGRPDPVLVSSNLRIKNMKTIRSVENLAFANANINHAQTLYYGDQAIVTHVDGVRIEDTYSEHGGYSGFSIGLCRDVQSKNMKFFRVACPVYAESLFESSFQGLDVSGFMAWKNLNSTALAACAAWFCDADLSVGFAAQAGYASSRAVTVRDVFIHDISAPAAAPEYRGVTISGRSTGGAQCENMHVENVTGRDVTGGTIGPSLVTIEGEINNSTVRSVKGRNVSILARANVSYITSHQSGSPVNKLDNVWLEEISAQATNGYAVYAPGSGPNHIQSGIRNSTFRGRNIAIPDTFSMQNVVR